MKPPKRILILSLSYFPDHVGGAEVAVKEITTRFKPTDIEFDMITLGDGHSPKEERIGNVHIQRVLTGPTTLNKLLYPFLAYWKASRMIKHTQIHAVWSIMASYAGFTGMLLRKKYPHIPFVLTIQEGDVFSEQKRKVIFTPIFKWMFKTADYITCISNHLATWSKHMGARSPMAVIPNAVDYEAFSEKADKEEVEKLAKSFSKKDDDFFVITMSRLADKNAIDDLITSMTFLPKNYKLLILGSGDLEPELKHLSLKLGLNYTQEPPINPGNRVHFMGYKPHSEMLKYLAISDVFVRASRSEGLGNSFLEAMAAKVPVVATPVGGIPDFLKDGETGLFCEVNNPQSIAQKIEKYMKDSESREFIISKAQKMVKDKYNWEKIASEMRDVFAKVILA